MNYHKSVKAIAQVQMTPHARTRAKAKVTVQSSEAKPYDQTASPALMEIRLSETFTGDIDGESPVRALQVLRDDKSASLVSMQRFSGKLGGRQGTFVLQGQKSSRTARSRRHGLSFPDRGQAIFPGCAARAALKATLEKGPTEGWIIGSNDVAAITAVGRADVGERTRREMYTKHNAQVGKGGGPIADRVLGPPRTLPRRIAKFPADVTESAVAQMRRNFADPNRWPKWGVGDSLDRERFEKRRQKLGN